MALSWLPFGKKSNSSIGAGEGNEDEAADVLPKIPENTLGLRVLTPPTTIADVDIVAVHGLGGDAFSTWSADGKLWLRDFLPDLLKTPPLDFSDGPEDSKTARVMTFGYNANMFTKASRERSFTFAEDLLAALKDRRSGDARHRPLILMGHSLGGIVIKKALIIAQSRPSQWGDLLKSVVHLCFFGTPHQGSNSTAGFLLNLGQALTGSKQGSVLRELELWSPSLVEANQLWVEIANGFTITSFYERYPYNGVQIVHEGSARLNRDNETVQPMDRNHINICKFGSIDEPDFRKVFSRLHAEVAAIGTVQQVEEQQQRVQRLLERNEQKYLDDDRLKVLKWLDAPPSRQPVTGKREPGTNEWFLCSSVFQDWLSGTRRYVFLYGSVGCGKTVLLKAIKERTQDHVDNTVNESSAQFVITFFYSSTFNERQGLNCLLRYIIAQICGKAAIPKQLQKLYETHNRSFPPEPADDDVELANVVIKWLTNYHDNDALPVYILIDGLDEISSRADRREVAGFLNQLIALNRPRLSILVTSRPAELVSLLQKEWNQMAIPPDSVTTDIALYVNATVARELSDLDSVSKQKVISKLAGPGQSMFRYASLQLQGLLDSGLLLRSDVDETLRHLPPTLNKTYDSILRNINVTHRSLATTALKWLVVARQPLLVEELIEACTITLEDGKHGVGEDRLTPAQILLLLPNLISIETQRLQQDEDLLRKDEDYIVFSHFSVKEYMVEGYMSDDISSLFGFGPSDAHQHVAKSCITYLMHSNTTDKRLQTYPLRMYAWDLWALHAVSHSIESDRETEMQAKNLFANIAFEQRERADLARHLTTTVGHRDETATDGRLVRLLDVQLRNDREKQEIALHSLQVPYFFPEYDNEKQQGRNFRNVQYQPIKRDEIRLLRLYPSRHWFTTARCSLTVTSLASHPEYAAISYVWADSSKREPIWLDGVPMSVMSTAADNLYALRSIQSRSQHLWLDSICIDMQNTSERSAQVEAMDKIYSLAQSVAICLGNASQDEKWALTLVEALSYRIRAPSLDSAQDLKSIVDERPMLDPFVYLSKLFERPWWTRAWTIQEASLCKKSVLMYGTHSLDLSTLEYLATHQIEVISSITDACYPRATNAGRLVDSHAWEIVEVFLGIRRRRQANKSDSITRLLFSTRYHRCTNMKDRFYSLLALLPREVPDVDNPTLRANYEITNQETCLEFCMYAIVMSSNLDIFSIFSHSEWDWSMELPSWASMCLHEEDRDHPQPLLVQELTTDEASLFCAGLGSFDQPPRRIDVHRLCLEGFLVDTVELVLPLTDTGASAYLEHIEESEYAHFVRQRRYFRTNQGFEGLCPLDARSGDQLAILIGGKTPYILYSGMNHEYKLIGECFVENIMYGELLEVNRSLAHPITLV